MIRYYLIFTFTMICLAAKVNSQEITIDPIELIGETVSVRSNSSYMHRLNNLMEEMGGTIYIDTVTGDLETDDIISMVVDGEIKYTVAGQITLEYIN